MNALKPYDWKGDMPNPRWHTTAPYSLRSGCGRAEGKYATVDEAVAAAKVGDAVVTYDGSWIVGYVVDDEDPFDRAEREDRAAPSFPTYDEPGDTRTPALQRMTTDELEARVADFTGRWS